MKNEFTPQQVEIDTRRSLLDDQIITPEIAIKARFAQEFGHVVLRHVNDEISDNDHDRFRELYIDKLMKHSMVIDRTAVARDFDIWVDAMLPAAKADVYDALTEQGTETLPEFISPERMSEMTTSSDDKLLHENLRLTAENARFMNQLAGMSMERRSLLAMLQKIQEERDGLLIQVGLTQQEVLSD